jgi:heme-degrading monooxygenase HmoA
VDEHTTYMQQLQQDAGPVVLINQFNVAPDDVEHFLDVWADDAAFMKVQPGFISTQLHRGIAGSTTFVNVAVWEVREGARRGFPIARVPATRRALSRGGRRGTTCVREGRGPGDLRGLRGRRASACLACRGIPNPEAHSLLSR